MYLKCLDIRGFKSFAEATHIEFTTGLNLIVGPNGCGKSNLVDAIRWVLGEQNVRNLRGQKLEDVIFAGTDQKKALSMASVSLTLDNTDQALPSPYTEIMINRRVYRSEQSEFYLNQQPVRLKDINQLFYGTGVGRKGYAIIGQGEIENLLSARPHDIRLMLEEASGLIRYRYQKDEAEERLRATDRDLQRLEDITGELAGRLQELKRKAERAADYLAVSGELQEVRTRLLKSEWSVLKRDIDQLRQTLAEQQAGVESGGRETALLEAEYNRLFADHQSLQQQLDQMKNQRYEATSQAQQFAAQRSNLQERLAEAERRREEITQEKARLAQQIEALDADLTVGRKRLAEQAEILQLEKQRLVEATQAWQQLAQGQADTGRRLEQLRKAAMDKAQEGAALRNRLQQANEEINQHAQRRQQFDLELEQRQHFMAAAQEQETRANAEIQSMEKELDQAGAEYARLQETLGAIVKERQQLVEQLNNWRQTMVEFQHELQSLQTIEDNYAGYSETIKSLLKKHKERRDFMPGLLGVVGELIQVPAGLETAIEVALGRGLENLVVAAEADVRQGIALLNREKLGRATFLPLDLLQAEPLKPALAQRLQKEAGVLGLASELVSYPAEAKLAFQYLLGRVAVVDDLETGLRLLQSGNYPLRLVTRQGELLLPQGAISGGQRKHDTSSVLKRKARYRALTRELEQLKINEQEGQAALAVAIHKEQSLQEGAVGWQYREQEIRHRLGLLTEEQTQARQQILQQKERQDEINWQRRLLQEGTQQRQQEIAGWEEELLQFAGDEARLQEELEQCKQDADDLLRRVEVDRERINTQEAVVKAQERELATLNQSRQQIENLYRNTVAGLRQQEERMAELARQKIQYEQQLVDLASAVEEKEKEQQQLAGQEAQIQKQVQEFNSQAAALMGRLNIARFELEKIQERQRQHELRLARQETEFELFDQQLTPEDKESPGEVLSDRKLRELRQREAGLSQRLDEIGLVDPGSVDEFKAASERYALLSTQYQDLTKARQSLSRLVRDSEQVMQGRFGDFLQEANISFNQTFVEIFGGGEAALIPLDDEEGDGGVELLVKMPGKKRQSLNMLSGGEKALTCIALVFSLLRLKPVPFCLLDEIDAALDEVNLQRFAQFISQLAQDRQFIIISHRQGTIEIAHTLYGVTMPQGGISTVLSMPMSEMEQLVG